MLLISSDIHIGYGPGDLLCLNLTTHPPREWILRIEHIYVLLRGTVVQVSLLGELSAEDPRLVHG